MTGRRHRAIPTGVIQGSPEWHELRLDGIGSSDAPVVAGEIGSVVELWAIKARLIEPPEPDEYLANLFEWGHRLEPVIADWYQDHTGRKVRRVNQMLQHPEVAWAFASLDRVASDRVVELKTTRRGWDQAEPIPGRVMTQVQHQLWVTGYDLADLVVLVGGSQPQTYTIERDDDFITDLVWLEQEFWDWVTSKTRPPVDGSETTRRTLGRLHPDSDGVMIQSDPDIDRVFFDWMAARVVRDQADDHVETLANTLRALIGDADGIDGLVTWRKNKDSVRVDWPSVAADYRAILDDLVGVDCVHLAQRMKEGAIDDLTTIQSIHTQTTEGVRVLRSVFKGDTRPGTLASVSAVETGEPT